MAKHIIKDVNLLFDLFIDNSGLCLIIGEKENLVFLEMLETVPEIQTFQEQILTANNWFEVTPEKFEGTAVMYSHQTTLKEFCEFAEKDEFEVVEQRKHEINRFYWKTRTELYNLINRLSNEGYHAVLF